MKRFEIENELKNLRNKGNLRSLKIRSNSLINLSSNDYLGITSDTELKKEFYSKYNLDFSSSSSRLIDGSYVEIMELEELATSIYKKPCLMFNSGFDANSCIIETFYNKNSLIITDKLNHASIYDGILGSKARFLRYKHLDLVHLEELICKNIDLYDDILVVSETIYSMDGDQADLRKLVELKLKYNFDLMIDEAHSYGVHGYGIAYNLNLVDKIDFLVIPLGKGGGSVGAMVFTENIYKDFLVNKGRKFIYSTALPPINTAWNTFILKKMPTFNEKQKKLEKLKEYTLELLEKRGLKTVSTTHIISLIIGENEKAIRIAKKLEEAGFFIYPVKEPTVPRGTARFRIGLNPTITVDNISKFIERLKHEIDSFF